MNTSLLPAPTLRSPALRRYATDPRAADWCFLLPELPRGAVLCVGGARSPVPLVLVRTAREVTVVAPAEDLAILDARARALGQTNIRGVATDPAGAALRLPERRFDLVAALRPAPGAWQAIWQDRDPPALADRVDPGGQLYLEITRPALL